MKFNKAIQSNIPELIRLLEILFEQESEFEPNSEAQSRALNNIILDPRIGIILVAIDNSQILGMVSLLFTESTALGARVAILEDMVVQPAFRGQGIGSKLITCAISEAKKDGCKRIAILTDITNTQAQFFYQKNGFVKSNMTPYRLLLE